MKPKNIKFFFFSLFTLLGMANFLANANIFCPKVGDISSKPLGGRLGYTYSGITTGSYQTILGGNAPEIDLRGLKLSNISCHTGGPGVYLPILCTYSNPSQGTTLTITGNAPTHGRCQTVNNCQNTGNPDDCYIVYPH